MDCKFKSINRLIVGFKIVGWVRRNKENINVLIRDGKSVEFGFELWNHMVL